jgi:hypothetical protein
VLRMRIAQRRQLERTISRSSKAAASGQVSVPWERMLVGVAVEGLKFNGN